ncbi:WXG100 family type VII secretion target, partial [Saccharopolyspora elongata]
MAIMFSEFERQLSLWLTGDEPPPVNEDKVRELAAVWRSHAARLRQLRVDVQAAVEGIRSSDFAGASERAFAARMAPFVDGPSNYLDAAADHFDAMADALDQIAMEVEFLKLVVLIQLALLAVEFEFFVQWFWVPGVQTWFMSQALMHKLIVEKAVRWMAQRMASVPRVPVEILGMLAMSFGQQLGVVWLGQQIQIGKGTREEHDGKHYESAAVIAAVGSVLSFGAMGALPKL